MAARCSLFSSLCCSVSAAFSCFISTPCRARLCCLHGECNTWQAAWEIIGGQGRNRTTDTRIFNNAETPYFCISSTTNTAFFSSVDSVACFNYALIHTLCCCNGAFNLLPASRVFLHSLSSVWSSRIKTQQFQQLPPRFSVSLQVLVLFPHAV